MPEISLIDGPHDGLRLSTALGAAFLWTDGKRCFRAPGPDRALYEQQAMRRRDQGWRKIYRFVGLRIGLCPCGVFRQRGKPCSLCGSEALAA